jgi:hypothetical protein
MAGDLNKPMAVGHAGLHFIQGRRIFIKSLTKGATSGSVFPSPTHKGILSFFI